MFNRFGKVDDGTTVTDFDDEEIIRKPHLVGHSAYAEWNKAKDQSDRHPGHRNFLARLMRARHYGFADAAAVVVDAVVRASRCRRKKMWEGGERAGAAAPGSCSTASTASARASTGPSAVPSRRVQPGHVPIQLPIGEEKSFRGVIDLGREGARCIRPNGSASSPRNRSGGTSQARAV